MAAVRLRGHEVIHEADGEELAPPVPPWKPEEKRPFIQALFTRIAPRYDWFNRLASFGMDQRWRRVALRRGAVEPGQRILDVCAGTGGLAVLCALRQRGHGVIVGLDMNPAMLAHARAKQRATGLMIHWLLGDAQTLPFPDDTFDRVLIGFSTRNLSALSIGLYEMVRVLRPKGKLVVLETGYPSNPLLRAGYQAFLFTVARLIGLLLTGRMWPFTYLARSVRQFLTPEEFVERLRRLETRVEYSPLSCGIASLYVATKFSTR